MSTIVPQSVDGGMVPNCGSLAAKLAKILGEIDSVPKSGFNEFHQYAYITSDDLVHAIRAKLAAAQIFVFTSAESQSVREIVSGDGEKTKRSLLTEVTLKHTFVDGETGQHFSVLSQGQGSDVGDKGGYKATTGAMKYFIYKCFMIASEDGGGDQLNPKRQPADAQKAAAPASAGPKPGYATPPVTRSAASGQLAWREVAIHFGETYKGVKLGDLEREELLNWTKWKPNPKYRKSKADELLETALAAAAKEIGG